MFYSFKYTSYTSFDKIILNYFIFFDATVNGIYLFHLFRPHLWHEEVPGPGINQSTRRDLGNRNDYDGYLPRCATRQMLVSFKIKFQIPDYLLLVYTTDFCRLTLHPTILHKQMKR